MLVFLVRHAHSDPGDPDELRPLSARGSEEARLLGARLAEHETPPVVVVPRDYQFPTAEVPAPHRHQRTQRLSAIVTERTP